MDFYQANLAAFLVANAYLLYRQYGSGQKKTRFQLGLATIAENGVKGNVSVAGRRFQFNFLLPYTLAIAADWLQGPHIYAIYKYEKNIPEKVVAALYATGFVSGGISASFAGGLADRFGRKRACLLYCALYVVTCATMLSDSLWVLFLGRLCGGVGTTLLFSVFEAWMISEYHDRCLQILGLELSSVFGNMTTLSCIAAIVSGVAGDALVERSGTRTWPFIAASLCCVGAACLISKTWNENYGSNLTEQRTLADVRDGVVSIFRDPRILSLGITSCFFEGAMYLFIFFWSAALKSARARSPVSDDNELPFGLIFSSFMCAMMAGSAVYKSQAKVHTVQSVSNVLMAVILVVSCCLSLGAVLQMESLLFWAFCLLEACIGAYFPSVAYLKSEVIEDGIRGRVYSILRFPLNVFVVVAHSLDEEGDSHRNQVFLVCSGLLLVAFLIARVKLRF